VPFALEVDLLVVHGLLHLVGYDDAEPAAARRMHRRARAILSSCRIRGRALKVPERLWAGLIDP
jgi:ssRNA-specific RNase YbeY (16S rRNA maturation enzyme)